MLAAIDIGGTKIRIGVAKTPTKDLKDKIISTPANQTMALKLMLETLLEIAGKNKIQSLGISSPGPIDSKNGLILRPRNIPWKNVAINKYFKTNLGCFTSLGHDATLGGVAEARLGSGKNYKVVLYVTLSTGIGSAIITNGKPLPTTYNSEGGLQIVQFRPFPPKQYQQLASGTAIKIKYRKIAADITNQTNWRSIARDISVGLFNLITIVQPDVVVLGGGVSVHYAKFKKPLAEYLQKYQNIYPLPPIKQAKFVETAPLVGALLSAQDEISPLK